jgi:hypothetical protein
VRGSGFEPCHAPKFSKREEKYLDKKLLELI